MEQITVITPQTTTILPKSSGRKVKAISLFTKAEQAHISQKCSSIAVSDGKKEFLVLPNMMVPKHYVAARQTDSEMYGIEKATGG